MSDQSPSIEEIRARRAAITPGPWKRDRNWYVTAPGHNWDSRPGCIDWLEVCQVAGPGWSNHAAADSHFIVNAPSDIDTLLSRVEADERRIKELEQRVKDLESTPRQMTPNTSGGAAERSFCLNHFSPRRDTEEPPVCEQAFAKGLYPCEFVAPLSFDSTAEDRPIEY